MKKPTSKKLNWEIIVIGGGPAGMMAAATAAANGASVLLIEKNGTLGKKLRISGGGRCNVTNNKPGVREMLAMYRGKGKFLFSTFTQHGVKETVEWFARRRVDLKEENEGRLFPITDSAETIYEAMLHELKQQNVAVLSGDAVVGIVKRSKADIFAVSTTSGDTYICTKCVIATGGTSRPETGSTGDGFAFAKKLGHTINSHNVALVPLLVKESWTKQVSGVALPSVQLTIFVDGKKHFSEKGKILFTHTGVSGPTILNMSKRIGELLESGQVTLEVDVLPGMDVKEVRDELTKLFTTNSNKLIRNSLSELVPTSLASVTLQQCKLDEDTPCHSVRAEDKKILAHYLQHVPLTITSLMGPEKAVISSGGVALEEIDFRTMESKVTPGLYLAGDMLDVDRPSGGYSLQLCWSTGFVAGSHSST